MHLVAGALLRDLGGRFLALTVEDHDFIAGRQGAARRDNGATRRRRAGARRGPRSRERCRSGARRARRRGGQPPNGKTPWPFRRSSCAKASCPPRPKPRTPPAFCRCSAFSRVGTSTITRVSRSPRTRVLTSGMPRLRSLNIVLLCVPAGIFRLAWPSRVGTWISPPSAAVINEIGTSQYRLSSSRWKDRVLGHMHDHVQIPGRAAADAGFAIAAGAQTRAVPRCPPES